MSPLTDDEMNEDARRTSNPQVAICHKKVAAAIIQGQACNARSQCSPPSFWTVWLGRLGVAFLLSLPGAIDARTDFDRMEQLAAAEYGQAAVARVQAWRALIEKNQTVPELTKLKHTNNFINETITYASDMEVWGVEDYWTTPLELFGKGKGDCEDYAIAKYITLRLKGVPVQKLRLVYVRARMGSRTTAHMVLSYYETPTADPLILDNLNKEILPAKRRLDLFPVFSFNHEGLWMEGERVSSGDPTARLSRWRDVLRRMRREGIDPSWTTISARSAQSWKQPQSRPQQATRSRSQQQQKAAQSRPRQQGAAQSRPQRQKIAQQSRPQRQKAAQSRPSSSAQSRTLPKVTPKHPQSQKVVTR